MTTTSYGTWNNHGDTSALTVADTVVTLLGDYSHDYDLDGLIGAYRDAINEALPPSVSLSGDEFYGPYYDADCDFDQYPTDRDGALNIAAIVEGIDFWKLAEKFDQSA